MSHKHFFRNQMEAYYYIYNIQKGIYLKNGETETIASVKANIFAVHNARELFIKNNSL